MRVLLTGTREFRDAERVQAALKHIVVNLPENEPLVVMHFATNIVDGHVDAIAKLAGISVKETAPDWRTNGKSALYRLVDATVPGADQVILFGSDAMTEHAITVANANGVKVSKVEPVQVLEALPI